MACAPLDAARHYRQHGSMNLTAHLPAGRRQHVEGRLRSNLMAWLTTVRPDGQPVSVPVWFLVREDETILIYTRPGKAKLHNIRENPKVTLRSVRDFARKEWPFGQFG